MTRQCTAAPNRSCLCISFVDRHHQPCFSCSINKPQFGGLSDAEVFLVSETEDGGGRLGSGPTWETATAAFCCLCACFPLFLGLVLGFLGPRRNSGRKDSRAHVRTTTTESSFPFFSLGLCSVAARDSHFMVHGVPAFFLGLKLGPAIPARFANSAPASVFY